MNTDLETYALQDDDDALFTTMGEFRRLTAMVPDSAKLSISQLPDQCIALSLALLSTRENDVERPDIVMPDDQHLVTNICICEVSKR